MRALYFITLIFSVMSFEASAQIEECDGSSPDAGSRPLVRIPPRLPDTPEAKESARVDICFDVEPEGRSPVNIRVINSTNSYFDQFAVATVSRWKYQPKLIEGHPAWRRGVLTRIEFLSEEDRVKKEEADRIAREKQKKAEYDRRLAAVSFCKSDDEPLEIEARCICAVDDVSALPWAGRPRPQASGYIGYVSKRTIKRAGLETIRANYLHPVRLTGGCEERDLCTEGTPVDGSAEACLIYNNWDLFLPPGKDRVVQRGVGNKYPRLYLQKLPEKAD